ncbi:MAG: hypothetical protein ACXABY_29610, partial [Candidatus Thorarchaeota archaeon]
MFLLYLAGGLFVLELLFLLWCVAWERPFSGLFSVSVVLVAVSFLMGWNLWELVTTNPLYILGGLGAYLAAGVGWSFPKWWFFVRNIRDRYLQSKERNLLSINPNPDNAVLADFRRQYS